MDEEPNIFFEANSQKKQRNKWLGKGLIYLFYVLVVLLFGLLIRDYFDQLESIAAVLKHATWYGLVVAVCLLIGSLLTQSQLFRALYKMFGFPSTLSHLWKLYLSTRFINVIFPSGGLAGMAPFIHDAKQRNLPQSNVIVINITYIILWYSAFSVFLIVGLIELFIVGQLVWFEVVAGVTLFIVTILMVGGMVAAYLTPGQLHSFVARLFDGYGRITHHSLPKQRQAALTFINELHTAFDALKEATPHVWLRLFLLAILNELLNLAILFVLSWTFDLPFRYGTLVAAYSIGFLFFILSPTPGGLGFVEGILLLVFKSVGHTQEGALILMLSYRGITFWLPFLLGFGVVATNRWQNPKMGEKPHGA